MTLAIELARRNVPCRVIDRAGGPTVTSRAFTVHARSLEQLEAAGLVESFLGQGLVSKSMDYRFPDMDKVARLDFTQLRDTRYPFILISNQNTTEALLRAHLSSMNVMVEWGTALGEFNVEPEGGVTASLVRSDGTSEVVHAHWLVGCDGLRSTVREQLRLGFHGDEYAGHMRMMDVPLHGFPLGDDRIHYLHSHDRMLLVTKLPGANYRVLISELGGSAATDKEVAQAEFQQALDEHFGGAVSVGVPEWTTRFVLWKRLSAAFRRGRVLLCGDAGHIHSPAGGMGLNAGMGDAFNLGWKLAAVVHGDAHPGLLNSYETERLPIAAQVIEATDMLHQVIMAHDRPLAERIAIAESPGFNDRAVTRISGLAYTYRDTMSSTSAPAPSLGGLAAGDRAPNVGLYGRTSVHDLLHHTDYTLLAIHHSPRSAWEHAGLAARVAQRFGDRIKVKAISSPGREGAPSNTLITDTDRIHDIYGAPGSAAACLIRPDGHVAARVPLAEYGQALADLETVLT